MVELCHVVGHVLMMLQHGVVLICPTVAFFIGHGALVARSLAFVKRPVLVVLNLIDEVHLRHETRASISTVHHCVTMAVNIGRYCGVEHLTRVEGSASQLAIANIFEPTHVTVDVCAQEFCGLPGALLQRLAIVIYLFEGESLLGGPFVLVDDLVIRFHFRSKKVEIFESNWRRGVNDLLDAHAAIGLRMLDSSNILLGLMSLLQEGTFCRIWVRVSLALHEVLLR